VEVVKQMDYRNELVQELRRQLVETEEKVSRQYALALERKRVVSEENCKEL